MIMNLANLDLNRIGTCFLHNFCSTVGVTIIQIGFYHQRYTPTSLRGGCYKHVCLYLLEKAIIIVIIRHYLHACTKVAGEQTPSTYLVKTQVSVMSDRGLMGKKSPTCG